MKETSRRQFVKTCFYCSMSGLCFPSISLFESCNHREKSPSGRDLLDQEEIEPGKADIAAKIDPNFEAAYLKLHRSGKLKKRGEELWNIMESCQLCPRECGANRLLGEKGFCHSTQLPIVAVTCGHHGEEPAISGSRGSGTIFFGNCNMRCVYCQNYQISQNRRRFKNSSTDCHTLAEYMLYLQNELECHNINLVSPSHFVPQLVRAVLEAVPMGLRLPLVYNTSGYDSVKSLKDLLHLPMRFSFLTPVSFPQ